MNSIISAHVLALLEDPNRKFSYCEQAFFSRWWEEQDAAKQADVRSLIDRGQLEFINGGWSMHDEACPTFVDMIDNTHLGGRLIYETFGVVPRTTWQIDPFGHSAFTGSCASGGRSRAAFAFAVVAASSPPPAPATPLQHLRRPSLG